MLFPMMPAKLAYCAAHLFSVFSAGHDADQSLEDDANSEWGSGAMDDCPSPTQAREASSLEEMQARASPSSSAPASSAEECAAVIRWALMVKAAQLEASWSQF